MTICAQNYSRCRENLKGDKDTDLTLVQNLVSKHSHKITTKKYASCKNNIFLRALKKWRGKM